MKRRAIIVILPLLPFWPILAKAAEAEAPAIAAPQAICVIPQAEPAKPEISCRVPFASEGAVCECRQPDGREASGKVKIVLPQPNRPLN